MFLYIISATILICSLFIKLPQIMKILESKMTASISMIAVLLEMCGHSLVLVYHFAKGYPATSYSEYIFLVPQDIILVSILIYFRNLFDMRLLIEFIVYFFIFFMLGANMFPDFMLQAAIILATPIAMISKSLQIYDLHKSKDVGQLSLTSWVMTTCCTIARLSTSIFETGDLAVLSNYVCSLLLNLVLMSQIIYYGRSNKEKVP